jgi:hypothetical protein
MARPPDIDDYERSIAMVSEAESNAVQPAVAKGRQPKGRQPKGRQQGIPPVGPAGGRGVEHGRVEQAPCGRRRKRAIGTDQARSPSPGASRGGRRCEERTGERHSGLRAFAGSRAFAGGTDLQRSLGCGRSRHFARGTQSKAPASVADRGPPVLQSMAPR